MEESFRVAFGRLDSSDTGPRPKGHKTPRSFDQGLQLYQLCVKFHLLTGLVLASMGTVYAKAFIRLLAGTRWSAQPGVSESLSLFCILLPLIGINGISESYVSSTAQPSVISQQSKYLAAFFAVFAIVGTVNLKVLSLGAQGLILANMANMILRIWWCARYIASKCGSSPLSLFMKCSPSRVSMISAVVALACSYVINSIYGITPWSAWFMNVGLGVVVGVSLLSVM